MPCKRDLGGYKKGLKKCPGAISGQKEKRLPLGVKKRGGGMLKGESFASGGPLKTEGPCMKRKTRKDLMGILVCTKQRPP